MIFPPTRGSRVPAIQPESVSQTDEATDPEPDTDDHEPVVCAHSSGPGGAVKAGDLYLYPFGNDAVPDNPGEPREQGGIAGSPHGDGK